jgi:4-amino-4-deoxychorismate lyase
LNYQFFDIYDINQANIQLDRGYLFGDGFYTTGIINNGVFEHQILHQNRLIASAAKLQFGSFDSKSLFDFIQQNINSVKHACIRITVSRAQSKRGYAFLDEEECNVCIQLSNLTNVATNYCELFFANTPISINPFLAGTKHLNRLDNVFAAKEIKNSSQECLMCIDELVICGSKTNLFINLDGTWLTPSLNKAGIEGITRQRVIGLMQEQNIKIEIRDINKIEVNQCDAAFVTNSLIGIWPVSKIENKPLATEMTDNLKCLLNFER